MTSVVTHTQTDRMASAVLPEGIHAYMQQLRENLLAVGLEEVLVPDSYDASENGSVEQVPTDTPTGSARHYSNWMHFAFTDEKQAQYPIVVSFQVAHGMFYNSRSDYNDRSYLIRSRVSKGITETGAPVGPGNYYNIGVTGSSNSPVFTLADTSGLGDFVRYTGDSLVVYMGLNAMRSGTGSYYFSIAELFVERGYRGEYAAMGNTSGYESRAQTVNYTDQMNSYSSSSLLARRGEGLGLYEKGLPVVSPIYSNDLEKGVFPLRRIFTVPTGIAGQGALVDLDFSGVRRPYLYIEPTGRTNAKTSGTALLYEWG